MLQLFGGIKESHYVRLCVLLAFCCVTVFIFISLAPSEDSAPQPKLARIKTMSEDHSQVTGGVGSVQAKDDEISEVVNKIKPIFEEASGKKFESLEVIHYKTQIVAGKNFFVKARAKEVNGAEQIVHLRIWKKLNQELELTAHQLDKSVDEELKYF